MEMKKNSLILLVVVALFMSACTGDDQGQIRKLVQETFDSAKRGDISFIMDRVHQENSALKLLLKMQEENPQGFDLALAELGARTKELLEGKELVIQDVVVAGDRAVVDYLLRADKKEVQGNCLLIKSADTWKMRTLPGLDDK